MLIVSNAFGADEILGGSVGAAMVMGIKRGLFSNEAGEGSTPERRCDRLGEPSGETGADSDSRCLYRHSAGVHSHGFHHTLQRESIPGGHDGIVLTQQAIDAGLGGDHRFGSIFVSVAIFFFAFTSIIANYYSRRDQHPLYATATLQSGSIACLVAAIVYAGAVVSLDLVWGFADITMALMTLCNLAAIIMLGKYAIRLLKDYQDQKRGQRSGLQVFDNTRNRLRDGMLGVRPRLFH